MSARPDLQPARTLAWLYAPAAQRPVLEALMGVEAQLAASVVPGIEHEVAHARLAWWSEECARCARGQAQHPLTQQLQALFPGQARAALQGLRGLVDTGTWDLASATFETRRELSAYCERWGAAVVEPLAAFALGHAPGEHLRTFGGCLRELELLNTLLPDARAGRVRVPLDELHAAQLLPEQLTQSPGTAAVAAFERAQHRRARAALSASTAALPASEQPALRALLVWARLAHERSQRRTAALPRAAPTGDHHAPLDGWRAWRAARRAAAGRFSLPAD